MKTILFTLLLLPCFANAQHPSFNGVYKTPELEPKARLKFWDTIRESYTFIPDSFQYLYSVMRPNNRVAVSVEYEEFGTWKAGNEERVTLKDSTGKEQVLIRTYITGERGNIIGYFERPPENPEDNNKGGNSQNRQNKFVHNKRDYYFAMPTRKPLVKKY